MSEGEIEYSPMEHMKPAAVSERLVPLVEVGQIAALLATCSALTSRDTGPAPSGQRGRLNNQAT